MIVKLNGGLGTSMGMEQAKSLLEVKEGRSFLDIIAGQVLELRRRDRRAAAARAHELLLHAARTRWRRSSATRSSSPTCPPDFLQNKEPKITVEDRFPIEWPDDPDLEWCPPGHGDVYTALQTSGTLDALLERGYEYAFLSNSDNLGAVLDPRVLSWFAAEGLPFVMEVCEKTPADRKGGHPAVLKETGRLVLRETAQTPEEDLERFADIDTLAVLQHQQPVGEPARAGGGARGERRRARAADDRQPQDGRPGRQVDARGVPARDRDGRGAWACSRARGRWSCRARRFAPVKTTSDLLVLRSDAYVLTDDCRVEPSPDLPDGLPLVELDSDHYKLLRDFDARFPAGPPSLVGARRLAVEGDVRFGREVVVRGEAEVRNDGDEQLVIDDGAVLEG